MRLSMSLQLDVDPLEISGLFFAETVIIMIRDIRSTTLISVAQSCAIICLSFGGQGPRDNGLGHNK